MTTTSRPSQGPPTGVGPARRPVHGLLGACFRPALQVVLLALDDLRFRREPDPETTFRELVIERREGE